VVDEIKFRDGMTMRFKDVYIPNDIKMVCDTSIFKNITQEGALCYMYAILTPIVVSAIGRSYLLTMTDMLAINRPTIGSMDLKHGMDTGMATDVEYMRKFFWLAYKYLGHQPVRSKTHATNTIMRIGSGTIAITDFGNVTEVVNKLNRGCTNYLPFNQKPLNVTIQLHAKGRNNYLHILEKDEQLVAYIVHYSNHLVPIIFCDNTWHYFNLWEATHFQDRVKVFEKHMSPNPDTLAKTRFNHATLELWFKKTLQINVLNIFTLVLKNTVKPARIYAVSSTSIAPGTYTAIIDVDALQYHTVWVNTLIESVVDKQGRVTKGPGHVPIPRITITRVSADVHHKVLPVKLEASAKAKYHPFRVHMREGVPDTQARGVKKHVDPTKDMIRSLVIDVNRNTDLRKVRDVYTHVARVEQLLVTFQGPMNGIGPYVRIVRDTQPPPPQPPPSLPPQELATLAPCDL
jgi:hypothetical protein